MRKWRLLGSVRGVRRNANPYREQNRPKPVILQARPRYRQLPLSQFFNRIGQKWTLAKHQIE